MTSEQNPESGTKTYTYDSDATCGSSTSQAGQLVKRVDAMIPPNVTCYAYDALNRNTAITYPSGPYAAVTPAKTFVYDATTFSCPGGAANVKTRLAEAYTGPSSSKITDVAYCYTGRGEIAEVFESTPHSAGTYQLPMTYWENGLMKTFGPFLTENQVRVTPDGEGRSYTINGASSYVPSITYNSASQPTQIATSCTSAPCYPIGYTYDPNTLRMTQYSAAMTNGTISGTLTWNQNGSLQKLIVADPLNTADAQTCNYSADDVGRIASANCGSIWSQTFGYDPFGNLSKSGSISWLPGYSSSTNQYTLAGTSYDANGNLLQDTFNTYTWDAEGKPLSTAYSGGQTWGFTYDAFGHKVELSVNGGYNASFLYLGKLRLSAVGQTPGYSEFPLPGGSVLAQLGGATGVQFADWQGTIRGNLTYTGGRVSMTGAHAPFGEAYAFQGGNHSSFTGQLDDGTAGNTTYYFPERQYRSNQGRWLAPDPAGLGAVDPSDPQSWNRYAYVRNSPLNRVDPQGLDDCGEGGCDGGGGGWDWACDWGCDSGGGGGTITIDWGSRGVNVGLSGFGGCAGESLGLPCGMNITDPNAALVRQAVIAAMKGNWQGVLGMGAAEASQDMWSQATDCMPICAETSVIPIPELPPGLFLTRFLAQASAAFGDLWDNYQQLVHYPGPRSPKPHNMDKYYHCMGHCQAASEGAGGYCVSVGVGYGREATDWMRGHGYDMGDINANNYGRRAGSGGCSNCQQACTDYFWQVH
jgi:RHS repeat-associated protein